MNTLFVRRRVHALGLLLALWSLTASAGGIAVQSLDGQRGGLGDHLDHGKWNIVMVWTTYCGVCREQYPLISEFHDKHQGADAVVLGISLDGYDAAAAVSAYRTRYQHSFPSVLSDADEFGRVYAAATGEQFTGTPTYLVFDKDGGLRAYLDGPTSIAAMERLVGR